MNSNSFASSARNCKPSAPTWNARRGCSWSGAPATMPALTNGGSHHLATFPCEAYGYGSERRPSALVPRTTPGSQRGSRRQDPRHPLRPDHAPSARATNPMGENPRASLPGAVQANTSFDPKSASSSVSTARRNAKRGQIRAEFCCRGSTPDVEFC